MKVAIKEDDCGVDKFVGFRDGMICGAAEMWGDARDFAVVEREFLKEKNVDLFLVADVEDESKACFTFSGVGLEEGEINICIRHGGGWGG